MAPRKITQEFAEPSAASLRRFARAHEWALASSFGRRRLMRRLWRSAERQAADLAQAEPGPAARDLASLTRALRDLSALQSEDAPESESARVDVAALRDKIRARLARLAALEAKTDAPD